MSELKVEPHEVREGDWLVGGPERRKVVAVTESTIWAQVGVRRVCVPRSYLDSLAALLGFSFVRDVPDTPRIPDEDGAVIRVHEPDDGYVYERRGGVWSLAAAQLDRWSHFEIQNMADKYGFTVLWPVPEPPSLAVGQVWRHEDGRTFQVREVPDGYGYADIWMALSSTDTHHFVTYNGLLAAGFTLDEETNR